MNAQAATVSASDRLGLTLFLAIVIHALIILGISFRPDLPAEPPAVPPLEVTIVQVRDQTTPPEDSQLLAQVSQDGGGDSEREGRPAAPLPSSMPQQENQPLSRQQQSRQTPPPQSRTVDMVMTTTESSSFQAQQEDVLEEADEGPQSAANMIEQSLEIARLSAEIDQSLDDYAKRQRHRFISARTRAFRDTIYLDAWRSKIERIGNLNYPEKARRQHLTGSLILDVAIKPDGSLEGIRIRRTSGHKVLDDAAIRIVRLAAPFAAFSEDMRRDTDILHITRTWQFMDDNHLRAVR